jgi:hypothetical protein
MTSWTKGDDAAVCLHYLAHGVTVTPELRAALAHLPATSIYLRLQNYEHIPAGKGGLSNATGQQRETWARVSAAGNEARVGDSAG